MTVVFNLFDSTYSGAFLKSWVNLTSYLNKTGVNYFVSQHSSCNAFYAKQMCLGGNVLAGPKQVPFQNKIKYDTLVFLSNKISFTPQALLKLSISLTKTIISFYQVSLMVDIKNNQKMLIILLQSI